MQSRMQKIICYELNEVPWRVVDRYLEERPKSALGMLLKDSNQFTTSTDDGGELHPWSTWPTVHRGVSNEVHKIVSLNQDLSNAQQYPPIWKILNKNNISTGVFGSLQSYPPSNDSNMAFHIPDTFAPGDETKPMNYQPFQSFNLKQTGNSKAVANNVSISDAVGGAVKLLGCGISMPTFSKIALQLAKEQLSPIAKSRRSLLQANLSFDIFMQCMKQKKPMYACYFTNHVAGVMHRYWKYTFPEDFDYNLSGTKHELYHKESIFTAMDIFDTHIQRLRNFCEKNGYEIIVASSMGQEAIDRGEYFAEAQFADFSLFVKMLGFNKRVRENLAMHPDLALEFDAQDELANFSSLLSSVTDSAGIPILKKVYEPTGNTLNVALSHSKSLATDKTLVKDGNKYELGEWGLELLERDGGTGYHQPKGILIWENKDGLTHTSREVVNSKSILPAILRRYGVTVSEYMQEDKLLEAGS